MIMLYLFCFFFQKGKIAMLEKSKTGGFISWVRAANELQQVKVCIMLKW